MVADMLELDASEQSIEQGKIFEKVLCIKILIVNRQHFFTQKRNKKEYEELICVLLH